MKNLLLILSFIFLTNSCSLKDNKNNIEVKSPTTDSFKDTSPYDFELIETFSDTFKLVSSEDYFYYSFGNFSNPKALLDQYNKIYRIEKELTYVYGNTSNIDSLYKIIVDDGYIKYYHDKEENKMHLVSGKLYSSSLKMTNGIAVGLSKEMFIKKLFGKNAPDRIDKFNIIQIETGLTGLWIIFQFRKNSLTSIVINTDYQFSNK